MLKAGTITPAVRALVSSLQQHKGSTAALDYVKVKVSTDKVSTDKKNVKKAPADVVDKVVKEVLDDVVDKVVKEAEEAPADVVDGATQAEQPPLVRQNAVSGGEDFGGDDDVVDGAADVPVLVPPAVDAAIFSVHAEISPDEYRFVHRLRLDDPARLLKLFDAAEARARSYQGAWKHVIREFGSELYKAVRADSTVEDAEQGASKNSPVASTVTAMYESTFTVDGNLDDAYSYDVKWDKLHVVWKEGDEPVVCEPTFGVEDTDFFKRPVTVVHELESNPTLVRQNAVTDDEDFDDDEVDDGTHWVDVVASELRSLYANGVDEGIVTRLHAAIALARYNDGEPIGDRQVEAPMLQAASIAAAHASNKRRRVD
jgi:hypothetical protein